MADIFLSYKREDREKVRPLVGALQAQGWSVWWDTRIGAGETWDQVIETELAAARCVVVVWSKHSTESRWVRSEAHEGLERECLVPVVIEGAKPPLAFKLVQSTDLTHWRGDPSATVFAMIAEGVQRIISQGTALSQEQAEGHNERGQEHLAANDYDLAIAAFTKAIQINPKFARAYHNRGCAHEEKRDLDRAIVDFSRAIQIDPNAVEFFLSRGAAHDEKKDYDLAVSDYAKAILMDPKNGRAYDRRAWAYYRRGNANSRQEDYRCAIDDFHKAIELYPKNAYLHFLGRGHAYLAKGDYHRAVANYDKHIEAMPANAIAYHWRGLAYECRSLAGDRERAIADYRKALEIYPEQPSVKERLRRLEAIM